MRETNNKEVEYRLLRDLRGEYSAFFVLHWLKQYMWGNNTCLKSESENYRPCDLAVELELTKQAVYMNLKKLRVANAIALAYNENGRCIVINPYLYSNGEVEERIYRLFDRKD